MVPEYAEWFVGDEESVHLGYSAVQTGGHLALHYDFSRILVPKGFEFIEQPLLIFSDIYSGLCLYLYLLLLLLPV